MKKLFLFFLFVSSAVHGAAPLYHALVAQKWLDAFEDYTENVPLEIIEKWHHFHRIYFTTQPSKLFNQMALQHAPSANFSHNTIQLLSQYLPLYSQHQEIQDFVHFSLDIFDQLLLKRQLQNSTP